MVVAVVFVHAFEAADCWSCHCWCCCWLRVFGAGVCDCCFCCCCSCCFSCWCCCNISLLFLLLLLLLMLLMLWFLLWLLLWLLLIIKTININTHDQFSFQCWLGTFIRNACNAHSQHKSKNKVQKRWYDTRKLQRSRHGQTRIVELFKPYLGVISQ